MLSKFTPLDGTSKLENSGIDFAELFEEQRFRLKKSNCAKMQGPSVDLVLNLCVSFYNFFNIWIKYVAPCIIN